MTPPSYVNPYQTGGIYFPQSGGNYPHQQEFSKPQAMSQLQYAAPQMSAVPSFQVPLAPLNPQFIYDSIAFIDQNIVQLCSSLSILEQQYQSIETAKIEHFQAEENYTACLQDPRLAQYRIEWEQAFNDTKNTYVMMLREKAPIEGQINFINQQLFSLQQQRNYYLYQLSAMQYFASTTAPQPSTKAALITREEGKVTHLPKSIEVIIPESKIPHSKSAENPIQFGTFTAEELEKFPSKGSLLLPPQNISDKVKHSPKRLHSSVGEEEDIPTDSPRSPKQRACQVDEGEETQAGTPPKRYALGVGKEQQHEEPAKKVAPLSWKNLLADVDGKKKPFAFELPGYNGPKITFEKPTLDKKVLAADKNFIDKTQTAKDFTTTSPQEAARVHILSRMKLFEFKANFCKSISQNPDILNNNLELKKQFKAKQCFVPVSLSRDFTKSLPEGFERAHVSIIPEFIVGPQFSENPNNFLSLQAKEAFGVKRINDLNEILNICDVAHSVINDVDCMVELELREHVIVLLNNVLANPSKTQEMINEFATRYLGELQKIQQNKAAKTSPRPESYLARRRSDDLQDCYDKLIVGKHKEASVQCLQGMIAGVTEFLKKQPSTL